MGMLCLHLQTRFINPLSPPHILEALPTLSQSPHTSFFTSCRWYAIPLPQHHQSVKPSMCVAEVVLGQGGSVWGNLLFQCLLTHRTLSAASNHQCLGVD